LNIVNSLLHKLSDIFHPAHCETDPAKAYNLWSYDYDAQPDNLMLMLEEKVFSKTLENTRLENKIILDIGCGTGRHWKRIFSLLPAKLSGYDVSEGMLKKLKEKYPAADVYLFKQGNQLLEQQNECADIIISTLTIAHIENIEEALDEWNRILKPGGEIIITDYHPTALQKGANRTFYHNGKSVAIKNYVHTIDKIINTANRLNFKMVQLIEKTIDETTKPFYEKQNALHVYYPMKGVPIVYGMLLKKGK
jgi:ubiquinone/menaquinone biosynthesis C-methylase UbiE